MTTTRRGRWRRRCREAFGGGDQRRDASSGGLRFDGNAFGTNPFGSPFETPPVISGPSPPSPHRPSGTNILVGIDVVGGHVQRRRRVLAAVACKRERARRLHVMAPAVLAELAKTDPSALVVSDDDLARASASALA
jgi:hypothetical protein